MSALGFLLDLITDSDDCDGEILDDASDISDDSSNISDASAETADYSPEVPEAPYQPSEDASVTDNTHQTFDSLSNAAEETFQPSEEASATDNTHQTSDSSYNATEEPSNIPDEPSETTDNSSETTDTSYRETNIIFSPNKPKRSWIYIAIGILGFIIIPFVIRSLGNDNSVPENNANSNNNAHALANKGTDVNTNMNDSTSLLDAAKQGDVNKVKALIDKGADVNAKDKSGNTPLHLASLDGHLEVMKLLIASNADVNARTNLGKSPLHFALPILESTEAVKLLISSGADVNAKDNNGWTPLHEAALGMGLMALEIASDATEKDKRELTERYVNAMEMLIAAGADINVKDNDGETPLDVAVEKNRGALANVLRAHMAAPSPAPTPNNNASDTEKRCDTQTISKEKHLPKWNIEIVDSSVIASMLNDAEKNHLPFLKINASDNLEQKLETYINKDPSKLHENSQNTFTCEPGNYIRTASNIGIQLVLCNDDEMSVAFLNLVSPVDNKARVYTAKTFDHLFEDAPVITKTEETVINGERGAYVAVSYETYSDGTGTEHHETDVVHYLFLGDKLRYLTDWNAFHIEESWSHEDDGTEEYDCDAKATVLRLENSGAKHQEHTFSNTAAPAPSAAAPAPSAAAPTPSPAPAQNTGDSKTKSIASTIMRYAEHEISLEEGKTVGQFFSIKKGLKPCLKSPKKCSKTIAPLVDESYVKFNRGVIAAILLQNNDTFNKDLFKEVQKTLLIPMNDSSERMRIANKSPVGREIMGANTLSNEDKINIFAIWYLRQFPYAGEDIWNNTPSTRRSWKDYLEMADLYLDAI